MSEERGTTDRYARLLAEHRAATQQYIESLDRLAGHEGHIIVGAWCDGCDDALENYREASVAHAQTAVRLGI
jgi:hypothetical protein